MTMFVYLIVNGYQFNVTNDEAVEDMVRIATDDLQEADIEQWIKACIKLNESKVGG